VVVVVVVATKITQKRRARGCVLGYFFSRNFFFSF
jgi:hypothetical protein